ncbi:hypothetical protein D3C83_121790 [compost metagenome]
MAESGVGGVLGFIQGSEHGLQDFLQAGAVGQAPVLRLQAFRLAGFRFQIPQFVHLVAQ